MRNPPRAGDPSEGSQRAVTGTQPEIIALTPISLSEALLPAVEPSDINFRDLLEAAPDAMVITDPAGRIVLVNSRVEALFGHRREELLGQSVELLIPERFRESHIAHRAGYAEHPHTRAMGSGLELYARRKDGSEFPVEVSLSSLESAQGALVTSAIRDISERRALERREQEFIAMVSHELHNPLTAIRGYTQRMRSRRAYDERSAEIVLRQTGRLERIIDDLLDVARLAAGRLELQLAPVDLAALVASCAEQAQELSRVHAVRVQVPQAPLEGSWDAGRLEQLLANLLSNAMKYSSAGGEVVVEVEDRGEQAQVSVTDHGPRIAPETLPRLFSRFYRTEAAEAGQVEGLGLGLYISRALIEPHGGRIEVNSELGRGSTFRFNLPYARVAAVHNRCAG
jgi:two-component system, OmpR family, phosphate regulon sensor histidine kinase PhoR